MSPLLPCSPLGFQRRPGCAWSPSPTTSTTPWQGLAMLNTCREGMAATIPPRSCALPAWHGHPGTSRRQTQHRARAAPALCRCRAWWAIQLHTQLSYMLAPFPHVSAFLSLVILPDGCPVSSDALPFPAAAQRGLKPGGLLGPSPSKG